MEERGWPLWGCSGHRAPGCPQPPYDFGTHRGDPKTSEDPLNQKPPFFLLLSWEFRGQKEQGFKSRKPRTIWLWAVTTPS